MKDNKKSTMFEMVTGPCFGRCPVYHLSVNGEGLATLEKKRFFKELGKYQYQLAEQTMIKIISTIDQVDFMSLPEKLESNIPDLQSTTFIYHEDGKAKSVWARENMPKALEILKNDLESIIADAEWTTLELYEQNPEDLDQRETVDHELRVKASKGVPLNRWQKKYADYGLKLVTRIDKEQNIWLYSYDKNTIAPIEMIKLMQSDPFVESVEFNYR